MIKFNFNLQFFAEEGTEQNPPKENEGGTTPPAPNGTDNHDKNAFAEGARKKNTDNNSQKDSEPGSKNDQNTANNEPNLGSNNVKTTQGNVNIDEILKENKRLKAFKYVSSLGVAPQYQEDVIAICIGNGLDPTEENLNAIVEKHDWMKQINSDSVERIFGATKGTSAKDGKFDEEAAASKLFN